MSQKISSIDIERMADNNSHTQELKKINHTSNKIIKAIKQLYNHIKKVFTLQYEGSTIRKINTEKTKSQNINDEIHILISQIKTEINNYYIKLIENYKRTGNKRKILNELKTSSFEKKLNALYIYYNNEMNNHINMSRKLENKIDVLEDEKQYFKKNWKNKISEYEKRINKLNEGIKHIEDLLKLDTEIKDVITDLLIILSDNKAPLNIQQQKFFE